jgi:hypothetical protein
MSAQWRLVMTHESGGMQGGVVIVYLQVIHQRSRISRPEKVEGTG